MGALLLLSCSSIYWRPIDADGKHTHTMEWVSLPRSEPLSRGASILDTPDAVYVDSCLVFAGSGFGRGSEAMQCKYTYTRDKKIQSKMQSVSKRIGQKEERQCLTVCVCFSHHALFLSSCVRTAARARFLTEIIEKVFIAFWTVFGFICDINYFLVRG